MTGTVGSRRRAPPWTRDAGLRCRVLAIGALLLATAASAEGGVPSSEALVGRPTERVPGTPWSVAIREADMARAEQLNEAGVTLLLEERYDEALELFATALAAWDHPVIRLNQVRALINLGRMVDAYESLLRALAYGHAPFDSVLYAEARSYLRLLEKQIATVVVTCREPGARLTLDGRPWLLCPGRASRYVMAGAHQVMAAKDGFLLEIRDVVAPAGRRTSVSISMTRVADAMITTRRWAVWKPWAVVGGGVALFGLGGLLRSQAISDRDELGREISEHCGQIGGCRRDALPPSVVGLQHSVEVKSQAAAGAMIAGGTVAVAGLILVMLNRSRTELPVGARTSISAAATRSGASVAIRVAF